MSAMMPPVGGESLDEAALMGMMGPAPDMGDDMDDMSDEGFTMMEIPNYAVAAVTDLLASLEAEMAGTGDMGVPVM